MKQVNPNRLLSDFSIIDNKTYLMKMRCGMSIYGPKAKFPHPRTPTWLLHRNVNKWRLRTKRTLFINNDDPPEDRLRIHKLSKFFRRKFLTLPIIERKL